MSKRRVHMATFPARREIVPIALETLSPQVDEIHLVLNGYNEVPKELARFKNLVPILPEEDTKDRGKFLPVPDADDLVFLADDDLTYDPHYCDWLSRQSEKLGMEDAVFGLHGRIFRLFFEQVLFFAKPLARSTIVDQLGTGTVLILGKNLPPYEYMATAPKFTDVRFAKWCHENKLDRICLARPKNMIGIIENDSPTIFDTFTRQLPQHVVKERQSYEGKSPNIGKRRGEKLSFAKRSRRENPFS